MDYQVLLDGIIKMALKQFCTTYESLTSRKWLLLFDDKDLGYNIYEGRFEALEAFEIAESRGFNCHLFTFEERV